MPVMTSSTMLSVLLERYEQSPGDGILQLKIKVMVRIDLRVICIEVIAFRNE